MQRCDSLSLAQSSATTLIKQTIWKYLPSTPFVTSMIPQNGGGDSTLGHVLCAHSLQVSFQPARNKQSNALATAWQDKKKRVKPEPHLKRPGPTKLTVMEVETSDRNGGPHNTERHSATVSQPATLTLSAPVSDRRRCPQPAGGDGVRRIS